MSWTAELDERLKQMWREGQTLSAIARELGRGTASISQRAESFGLARRIYDPSKPDQRAEALKRLGYA